MGFDRLTTWIARILLLAWPGSFRVEMGSRFHEGALHRLELEVRRRGRLKGWLTTVRVLLADTIEGAPEAWRNRDIFATDWRGKMGQTGMGMNPAEWVADLRLAVRSLVRRPALAAVVALTLGLGIGANVSIFSLLDRIVLNPFPFEGGDRVVFLVLEDREQGWSFSPFQELVDLWRRDSRTLESLEVYRPVSLRWATEQDSRVVDGSGVSWGMLGVSGMPPVLGRGFTIDDARADAPEVIMIDENYWRGEMGSDPAVIGSTIEVNRTPRTVIGIWPSDFRPNLEDDPVLWEVLEAGQEAPRGDWTMALAVKRPGVSDDAVVADLVRMGNPIAAERELPGTPGVRPASGFTPEPFVQSLWVLFWGTLALGAVAAVNAANLLLGRAASRSGELGVRLALGGGTIRLLRLFAAEALVLSALGIVVAALIATAGSAGLLSVMPNVVENIDAGLLSTPRVMLWGVAIVVVLTLTCVAVPATQLAGRGAQTLIRGSEDSRTATAGTSRLRAFLVASQVAIAVVIATGATLALRSYRMLASTDPGFAVHETVVVGIPLPEDQYPGAAERGAAHGALISALEARAEVTGVTTSANPFFSASVNPRIPLPLDWDGAVPSGSEFHSSNTGLGNYFDVLGIPLRGEIVPGVERTVVVNEAYIRRFGDVVGREISVPGDSLTWLVTGVAADVRSRGLADDPDRLQLYYAEARAEDAFERYIIRTSDPELTLGAVRGIISGFDSRLTPNSVVLGSRLMAHQTGRERFVALLLAVLGVVTLIMATAGVYAVVNLDAQRRTREVGIRIALGARGGRVVGDLVRNGMTPVVLGAVIGLALAWGSVTQLEAVLYRIPARDPVSLVFGAVLLVTIGALASAIPARRATRVDPVVALRVE